MYKRQMLDLKPTKVMQEVIYIKTNRIGFIGPLGVQGPIVTPIPTTRQIAKAMVVSGIETYMVDKKTKEVTLLTLQNVFPGEGDPEPPKEEDDTNKKPESGVANQKPVKPVEFHGVSTKQEQKEEKKDTTATNTPVEQKKEEVKEEPAKEEKKEDKNNKDNKKK